jgi:hypothetical protein
MVFGAIVYKKYCFEIETRKMVMIAMIISIIGQVLLFIFAKRWNLDLGISDVVFLFFTDVIFNVLGTVFFSLPVFSFLATITPAQVEATVYAFLTGATDLCFGVISPLWGSVLNRLFVRVTKEDLSSYHQLVFIGLIGNFLVFAGLKFIPTKPQIEAWR